MIKCSVCILTYNSEKTLNKCLDSVRDFSDILILDGGSSDKTLDIAKQYGARVLLQDPNGNSEKIENFTVVRERLFNLAHEDWRLWLDSDEWLSKKAREDIMRITSQQKIYIIYSFIRKAVVKNRIIEYMYCYPEYCRRLYNKNSAVYLKKGKFVHEDLIYDKCVVKEEKLNSVIYHIWHESYRELLKKDNHYLSLTVHGKENFLFSKKLKVATVNLLKGIKVFIKSLLIYFRHGTKNTLPIAYSWRFVRYHLVYAKKILTI